VSNAVVGKAKLQKLRTCPKDQTWHLTSTKWKRKYVRIIAGSKKRGKKEKKQRRHSQATARCMVILKTKNRATTCQKARIPSQKKKKKCERKGRRIRWVVGLGGMGGPSEDGVFLDFKGAYRGMCGWTTGAARGHWVAKKNPSVTGNSRVGKKKNFANGGEG